MEILLHRIELSRVAGRERAQERAHRRRRGRPHAQHLGSHPAGAQHVDVLHALAARQQRRDQRQRLHVRVGRARHLAQVDVLPEQLGQAQTLTERGRQNEAGIGDQALRVKADWDDVR